MKYKNASFIKRLIAFLLDALFITSITKFTIQFNTFLPIIISLVYFAYFESSKAQATLGKQIVSLKVVNTTGEKISFLNAALRHIVKMIGIIFVGIGYLPLLIGKEDIKRSYVDLITATQVIDLRNPQ